MYQRLTVTLFIFVFLNSIPVKSYSQPNTLHDLETSPSSREIDSGFGKYFWNVDSGNSPGSEVRIHHDNHERERRRYSGRIKRRMICARQAALQKKKRQDFRHGIKLSSEKENVGELIENALQCNYERVRRELRKINITLAPQEELNTNFQIIIDSELAKTILRHLSILTSSRSSEEESTTSISMTVKDNEKEKGVLEEHTDQTEVMNENETETEDADENEKEEHSEAATEVPFPEDALTTAEDSVSVTPSAEQEIELATLSPADEEEEENTQAPADEENELSSINSSEREEEPSPLLPTETTMVENELNGDGSTGNQIDENAGNSLTCNFTAYQETKLQCNGTDDATEGEGLPCSMMGLWVSDAGGVQLDIKDGSSRGFLDIQVHDLTPPKKGFLSPSWKIIGQLPFLDMDENVRKSESKAEDSLGGIFSITATIPGASSETGEKQLAIFIGECHVCDGGIDTIVGTWSLKRPSKSCRDAILSLQEIPDVLRRDILSESIKSKSRRMVNHKAKRAHRGKLYRNKFRIFH